MSSGSLCDEIERIRKVSDTLCTAHAALRDRYTARALMLDVSILSLSLWLVALAFVDPKINAVLTPSSLDPQLWLGIVAIVTFLLTIVQLKTDWKGRADAHKRSLDVYAEVKREAGYLLATGEVGDDECRRVLARYDMASAVAMDVPESDFLPEKRRHKIKVAISKHLDTHPSASITLLRIRLWIKDNLDKRQENET